MSSDLQATLEFCLELHKFYNVDLFLRGFYKIQASLRATNTKLPVRIEMSNSSLTSSGTTNKKKESPAAPPPPQQSSPPSAATTTGAPPPPLPPPPAPLLPQKSSSPTSVANSSNNSETPPPANSDSTSSTTSSSRPFRILFRSEELDLRDIFVFRVHFNFDGVSQVSVSKLMDDLSRVEYILEIKLCFNDAVVSSRKLTLNLTNYTINYYRPVFFDYFHLCAVSLSVHGGLIAFHVTKNTLANVKSSPPDVLPQHQQVVTTTTVGGATVSQQQSTTTTSCVPSCSGVGGKLVQAKATHESIMAILTESNASLKTKLVEFLQVLGKHELVESIRQHHASCFFQVDFFQMQQQQQKSRTCLSVAEEMEEYLMRAHKQIAGLCAENILLWHRFLDLIIGKDPIRVYLANLHHQLRVKRFSEGFYITENPLRSAYTSKDYSPIVELLKKSINYSPLPLECTEIDGDSTSIPIIFEDMFSDVTNNKEAASASTATEEQPVATATPTAPAPCCTCGIVVDKKKHESMKPSKSLSDVSKSKRLSQQRRRSSSSVAREQAAAAAAIAAEEGCVGGGTATSTTSSTLPRRHSSWGVPTSSEKGGVLRRPSRHSTNSHVVQQEELRKQRRRSQQQILLRKFNSTPQLLSEVGVVAQDGGCGSTSDDDEEEDQVVITTSSSDEENNVGGVSSSNSSSDESGWVSEDNSDHQNNSVVVKGRRRMILRHNHHRKNKPPIATEEEVIPPPLQFQDGATNNKPPARPEMFRDDKKVCSCMSSNSPAAAAAAALLTSTCSSSPCNNKKEPASAATTATTATFLTPSIPYFLIPDELRVFHPKGLHLIICVHGLDGSCHDLRLFKIYLEVSLSGQNVHFLMSEKNQDGSTFNDFNSMTGQFVSEILSYISTNKLNPARISFVGHSLGNIIIRSALTNPALAHLLPKLHTFLSLSGPHLGTLYNTGIVNMGMWLMQKWKKSSSLLQLSMKDHSDIRQTFLYKLSEKSNLDKFRYVLLCGSAQDRYVPVHSAHIINCKHSLKDYSNQGTAYREMVMNILSPLLSNSRTKLIRYDVHHAIQPHTANSIIGRAAHIAVLDSEIFIEKFLSVSGVKYFQ